MPYDHDRRSARRLAVCALALCGALQSNPGAAAEPAGPSAATVARNQAAKRALPADDGRDLDFSSRGFIKTRSDPVIRGADGRVVWDLRTWDFLAGEAPATVNPSLWRQARLLARHGLFRVTDRIYQVRGFDAANITFVRGDTGWIVIDTLGYVETAAAALALVNEALGQRPITAIVYTHPHTDHYGGAGGLAGALAKGAPIIAPQGFLDAAVSETVIAGQAMLRRAAYQFGFPLERSAAGTVGIGVAQASPFGTARMLPPTQEVSANGSEQTIDGVRLRFQLTPGTEAPAEMNIGFPDWNVVDMAENANVTQHNLLPPRGAKVRDAKAWADGLTQAIDMFGGADVMIASHGWPRFGAGEIRRYLGSQRDAYKFLHDQTVRLMNDGLTGDEIAARLKLPATLEQEWFNRPYYGSLSFNARAVYQSYMGWYDGNPVHLAPLSPEDAARRYVGAMGGAARVYALAEEAYGKADYAWAAELLNRVVFSGEENGTAKALLVRCYEQMAWSSENAVWRNIYLTGASELRRGPPKAGGPAGFPEDLSTPALGDLLSVRLDADKVGAASLDIGLVFPERAEEMLLSVANGVLTHRLVQKIITPVAAVVTLPRSDLVAALLAGAPVDPKRVTVRGDAKALPTLAGWMDRSNPAFAIVTPD